MKSLVKQIICYGVWISVSKACLNIPLKTVFGHPKKPKARHKPEAHNTFSPALVPKDTMQSRNKHASVSFSANYLEVILDG